MMHTVNHAIEDGFQNHWITSASIMVPCPWFPEISAVGQGSSRRGPRHSSDYQWRLDALPLDAYFASADELVFAVPGEPIPVLQAYRSFVSLLYSRFAVTFGLLYG